MKLRQFAILSLLSLVSIWYASAQSSRADSLDQQLIQTAGYGNTAAVLSLLQRGANIEAKDNFIGNTPLIEAAGDGNADTVKLLLDKGANIEAKNKSGETPLLRALGRINNADVVKLLIDRKANLEVANDEGRTPLFLETSIGTPELDIVKLLLDQGAKVDATDGQGNTPLFWAVSSDNADLVKLLLDRGANIEARNKYYGDTPLMAAAGGGHADLVKLLLNRGANPEAKDDSGNTARDLAESRHRAEALQVLEEARLSLVKENPRTTLNAYIDSLAKVPSDDAIRNKIIELVTTLQPPPSIPDEARQHFMKGVALMKVKSPSHEDILNAINEFKQSVLIAPWWGDGYYNLARAQETGGFYDDAASNLNLYLKTKPSDADAQDAQARIYAIQAEKQSAAQAKEQHERELAFKYVSGGAARVRSSASPELWGIGHNYGGLYGYTLPDEDPYFANIFLMPDGRYLAITLAPVTNPDCSGLCDYTGDNILIADVAADGCGTASIYTFGDTNDSFTSRNSNCAYRYSVSVSAQPNAIVRIANGQAAIAVPVDILYRGRAIDASLDKYGSFEQVTIYRNSAIKVGLNFDKNVLAIADDQNVNPLSLTPLTYVPH